MASFLREALLKRLQIRFIATTCTAPKTPNIPLPLPSLQSPHLSQPVFDRGCDPYPDTNAGLGTGKELSLDPRFQVYPSFSFAYFLNPTSMSPPGSNQFRPVDEVVDGVSESDDDPRKLWADSVKKKRKRKMNKHKYKKLRKRLRRKT